MPASDRPPSPSRRRLGRPDAIDHAELARRFALPEEVARAAAPALALVVARHGDDGPGELAPDRRRALLRAAARRLRRAGDPATAARLDDLGGATDRAATPRIARPSILRELDLGAAGHEALWGPMRDDLAEALRALNGRDPGALRLPAPLVRSFHELRPEPRMPFADFARRLQWGADIQAYLIYLQAQVVRQRAEAPGAEGAARLNALARQVPALILPPDRAPLLAARDEGRSVVLLLTHLSLRLGRERLTDLGLPVASVSYAQRAPREGRIDLQAGAADAPLQLLRLAKAMRAAPHVLTILPDGQQGEGDEVELFGRPLRVGRGAALLAHRSRAATFFATLRLAGEAPLRWAWHIVPGPVADGPEDGDAFAARLAAFYRDRLADILLGPPEDIGPTGAVAAAVRKSPA